MSTRSTSIFKDPNVAKHLYLLHDKYVIVSHLSLRDVADNFKVTNYNVASRIIYEWGTCTGAIRRLRFELVNIEIMQYVFIINAFIAVLKSMHSTHAYSWGKI
jgi:hypothetical protein